MKPLVKSISLFLYCFSLLIVFISCSEDEIVNNTNIIPPDADGAAALCESGKTAVFIEKDGMLVIESENSDYSSTPWSLLKRINDFSGEGYLVWNGADFFQDPGQGVLTYKIRITKPGTYRFIWRSYITVGNSGSDFNDSWLRIPDAKHFYGKKGDGHIVYPKGTTLDPIPESAGQASTTPEGAGKNGWFKIYMNTAGAWQWQSSTSDNDGHNIFAVFDTAGDYTIEISGRSKGHGIDKFVLYTDGVTQSVATDAAAVASEIKCE